MHTWAGRARSAEEPVLWKAALKQSAGERGCKYLSFLLSQVGDSEGHVSRYFRDASRLGLQLFTGLNTLQNTLTVSQSLVSFPSLCFPTSEFWNHFSNKSLTLISLSLGLLLSPALCHLCSLHLLFSSPRAPFPVSCGPCASSPLDGLLHLHQVEAAAVAPRPLTCVECSLAELGPT